MDRKNINRGFKKLKIGKITFKPNRTYKNIHEEIVEVEIDPKTLNPNTEVIRF